MIPWKVEYKDTYKKRLLSSIDNYERKLDTLYKEIEKLEREDTKIHGRRRKGAGRPAIGTRKVVSISLPDEYWKIIDKMIENREVKGYSEYFRNLAMGSGSK